jgi:hypothetical protein
MIIETDLGFQRLVTASVQRGPADKITGAGHAPPPGASAAVYRPPGLILIIATTNVYNRVNVTASQVAGAWG